MKFITKPVSMTEVRDAAKQTFGDMVKGVVDIEKMVLVIGTELHADAEATLLNAGSKQANLWGINLYVDRQRESWIEFDSMINIRPSQGNRSRTVENPEIQEKIKSIVNRLIT